MRIVKKSFVPSWVGDVTKLSLLILSYVNWYLIALVAFYSLISSEDAQSADLIVFGFSPLIALIMTMLTLGIVRKVSLRVAMAFVLPLYIVIAVLLLDYSVVNSYLPRF